MNSLLTDVTFDSDDFVAVGYFVSDPLAELSVDCVIPDLVNELISFVVDESESFDYMFTLSEIDLHANLRNSSARIYLHFLNLLFINIFVMFSLC